MQTPPNKVSCSICLTPFAPGVAGLSTDREPLAHEGPWIVLWSAPLWRAMLDLAHRLAVRPDRLTVHEGEGPPHDHADIEIRGPARGFDAPQVLALVAHGMTADQARAGLAEAAERLSRAGRPQQGRPAQGRAA